LRYWINQEILKGKIRQKHKSIVDFTIKKYFIFCFHRKIGDLKKNAIFYSIDVLISPVPHTHIWI
jgi:hypothetical protein